MAVTPGDILARCKVLDGRITAASAIVDAAPAEQLNPAFRDAWMERLRRWEGQRAQCSDYASRMWNFKWGPILDDCDSSQAEWEAKIQLLTGQVVPIGKPLSRPDDETLTSAIEQAARFPNVTGTFKTLAIAGGVGLAAGICIYAWRKGG